MPPRRKTEAADPRRWIRPTVRELHAYTPGEQPKVRNLIKLNTNENPYPPSPRVLEAIRDATDSRLRLYPNPGADALRDALADLHGCSRENLIVGNGSDELLAMAIRCFVEPRRPDRRPDEASRTHASSSTVQYFWPSYSLYPVLAAMHPADVRPVALRPDFTLPIEPRTGRVTGWATRVALSFVTTPNAPGGRAYSTAELESLCRMTDGVVVLDEAYVDFARENAMELALRLPNVLVSRTFSKAYSLCFQRVGYMVGHPELIAALHKIRDSYSVNGLGQVGALATLRNLEYYRRNFRRVIATRSRLSEGLGALGFEVFPSETNFVLVRPPLIEARAWLDAFRERRILVRWFSSPDMSDFLRISVGTDPEIDQLLAAAERILRRAGRTGAAGSRNGRASAAGVTRSARDTARRGAARRGKE